MSIKEALQIASEELKERQSFPEKHRAEMLQQNRGKAEKLRILITETHNVTNIFNELANIVDDALILEQPIKDEGRYGITFLWGFTEEEYEGKTYTRWNSITARSTYGRWSNPIDCPDASFTINGSMKSDSISDDPTVTEKLILEQFVFKQERNSPRAIMIGNKNIVITELKDAHKSLKKFTDSLEKTEKESYYFSGREILQNNNLLSELESFKESNQDAELIVSLPESGVFAVALRWNHDKGENGEDTCKEVGIYLSNLPMDTEYIKLPHAIIRTAHILIWGATASQVSVLGRAEDTLMSKTVYQQRFKSNRINYEQFLQESQDSWLELNSEAKEILLQAIKNPFERHIKDREANFPIPRSTIDKRKIPWKEELAKKQAGASRLITDNYESERIFQQQLEEEEEAWAAYALEEQLQQEYEETHQEHPTDGCYEEDGYWTHDDNCEESPSGD